MDMKLELIKEIADNNINTIRMLGYAKAGNNGPYLNKDTPVRNSAHWLISYCILWELTGNSQYLEMVKVLSQYLCKKELRGMKNSIICMEGETTDKTNGVIGQAWVVEALIYAYDVLKDEQILDIANKIFYSQEYNWNAHVWEVIDVDGQNLGFDRTYNHQLWFAAAGAMLYKRSHDSELSKMIIDFLDNSNQLFYTHSNGLLYHQANCRLGIQNKLKFFVRKSLAELAHISGIRATNLNLRFLEEGYHLFDMYGFSLIYNIFPDNIIFKNPKYLRAVDYVLDSQNLERLLKPSSKDKKSDEKCKEYYFNGYAYGYNSPAFEYPYVAYVLTGTCDKKIADQLWDTQIDLTFNEDILKFGRNNMDEETLTARVYEYLRYVHLIEVKE